MIVYADIFILVNIYTDYFLLLAVEKFLRLQTKKYRIFLGAVVGGLSGLLSLLPLGQVMQWIILTVTGFAICAAAFYNKSFSSVIKPAACFLTFSALFSGIIALLINLVHIKAAVINGKVYFNISLVMLLVFTTAAYIISLFLEKLKGTRTPDKLFCHIDIENLGKSCSLLAKLDTGNDLREPFSSLPVMVISCEACADIIPESVKSYIEGKEPDGPLRLIPFSSVGGTGLLPCFKAQKVTVKDKTVACYIAVFKGSLSSSSYSAIINPAALENII